MFSPEFGGHDGNGIEKARPRVRERTAAAVDRWVDDQMFEEDLRAVRPHHQQHRRERLMGWREYRTGGRHFRATIAWDEQFAEEGDGGGLPYEEAFSVPNTVEVLETILLGSIRSDADLDPEQEGVAYLAVVKELVRRVERFVRNSC